MLEGSVQRDQSRVRVNAQLIDAESGAHLWADRFEETRRGLIQAAGPNRGATGQQRCELVIAEAEKGAQSKIPDAIDLTMRGRPVLGVSAGEQGRKRCGANLVRTGAQDRPKRCRRLGGFGFHLSEEEVVQMGRGKSGAYKSKILGLANRAIELDPNNVTAYLAKAYYMALDNRWNEVIRVANAGLAFNPNSAILFALRGFAEGQVGRYDEKVSDLEKARRLGDLHDPDLAWWAR